MEQTNQEAVAYDECGTKVFVAMGQDDTLAKLRLRYPEWTFRYVQDVPDYSEAYVTGYDYYNPQEEY